MAKRGRPKGSKNKSTAGEKAVETTETVSKQRGRPKGSKNKPKAAPTSEYDSSTDSSLSIESAPKKRGRPKGAKNRPKGEVSDEPKRGRGRPKGSKNKSQELIDDAPKKRGRPKGSGNKKPITQTQKESAKKLKEEILKQDESTSSKPRKEYKESRSIVDQILFKLPIVDNAFEGTPKEVQKELDNLAIKMQKDPNNNEMFDRIHLYMHGYLVNVVLKKFPFIKGSQTVDIYQETLIALRFKAIPGFKKGKGMSFLNFSKLCIRRHLITILHQSRNGLKNKAINFAISLDSTPSNNNEDSDGKNTFANTIGDDKAPHDEEIAKNEAFGRTKDSLADQLSDFEQIVLDEYLSGSPYKEISKNISEKTGSRCGTKRVDNALLRIRKKAMHLRKHSKLEDIPMFLNKKEVDDRK